MTRFVISPSKARLCGSINELTKPLYQNQIKDATAKIKELADVRTQSMEDVDTVLRVYHSGIVSGKLNVGEPHILDKLLEEHRAS